MRTISAPTRATHPHVARLGDWLPTRLAPLAAELVGTLRDYSPDDVGTVLAQIPDGRRDELVLLLAAMVDPDRTPAELLAWTTSGPVPSRDGVADADPVSANPAARPATCGDCGRTMRAGHLARHRRAHHPDNVAEQAA